MEELGHKANAIVAEKIVRAMPDKALLRCQTPPNFRRLAVFAQRMTRIGYDIDTTTSGTLWNSVFNVDDDDLRKVRRHCVHYLHIANLRIGYGDLAHQGYAPRKICCRR